MPHPRINEMTELKLKPVHLPQEWKQLDDDRHEIISMLVNNLWNDYRVKSESWALDILRNHAQPPIKGEVTKGKVRWRGIRRVVQSFPDETRTWIEQRGAKIGGDFVITSDIDLYLNDSPKNK